MPIKKLKLGAREFNNFFIQGPLAGVSTAPFRALTWRYSKPAFCCTEMISCKTILYQSEKQIARFISKADDEGPVCFQLSSTDPKELGEAVKKVTQQGADLIDLNCGCPVKKIRSRGAGSHLLQNPNQLFELITAMKSNTHLPVSIKIRVENGIHEHANEHIAQVITDAGADFVIVHGRHWTQHYETACNHDEIKFFVDTLKIPVIGNGDIACITSLKKMLATGCAGVMVGRAGVGQPWLIAQLNAELNYELFTVPNREEIGNVLLEHTERLIELLQSEKFAILQIRKLVKYYARSIANRVAFCNAVNTCSNLLDFKKIVNDYFCNL